jgi:hypothetical protein
VKKVNNLLAAILMASATVTGVACANKPAPEHQKSSIVGSWVVDVQGAAFAPHLFVFTDDGVVLTTNPSRVQEKADGSGVNDSLGMGTWRLMRRSHDVYEGTFLQLNATQGTPVPAATLIVTFRIEVSGDHFVGRAQAALSSNPDELFPATFAATRIQVNEDMLGQVGKVGAL